ncbi:hypothetical protein QQS21_008833 [Conoideocrella luteorostrata]|uniref:Zn(2)-C6 fungal-type domain-containing protein n=1 Tax=Conoideocrella luteorostrata TaxID=1105319 RepID=A0AAJ0FYC2_9HYPO|nr:hypothetical protein QQS21_008833 [Conoideocrella luteorostrata]
MASKAATATASRTPAEPDFRVLSFRPQLQGGCARKYERRRTHQKSRTGCVGCKVKRVKCDEARPSCSRCCRSGSWCTYPSNEGSSTLDKSAQEKASIILGCKLKPTVCLGNSPTLCGLDPEEQLTPHGTPRMLLMHHFQHFFPDLQLLERADLDPILSLSMCRPFLLDAMLAVSASHLRSQSVTKSSHRIAEHFQQALALKNFQGALQGPLDQQTADALLLTAMFINLLNFSVVEDDRDVFQSWVYTDHPERLGWLSLSLGIKPLICATEMFRENTILWWMYDAGGNRSGPFRGLEEYLNLHSVPSHWLDLFELPRDAKPGHRMFDPIRILKEINGLEPIPGHFFLYVNLIGDLDGEFRDELERRDERAMWVIGYWLGLLCRYDFWWLRKRAVLDYRAVRRWLNEQQVRDRPGTEGIMWMQLMDDLESAPYWKGIESASCRLLEEL